ncbi:MAG TPA: hypothetical protein VFE58_04060 [Tepidisphaeraceae bacterium]|nr:hypothetical protein [Tepidisphaeraceae bacterium]
MEEKELDISFAFGIPTGTPNGLAWAALLSSAIGCAAFGVATILSESSANLSQSLNWYRPSGSLSGVAGSAVAIWLVSWITLALIWKGRRLQHERTLIAVILFLVLASLIATFPPFYEIFARHS